MSTGHRIIRYFPQSLQVDSEVILEINSLDFPSALFPIHNAPRISDAFLHVRCEICG